MRRLFWSHCHGEARSESFFNSSRTSHGSLFPANLSALYQVSQQPLIPIDALAILPIFRFPLQHLSHEDKEKFLLLAL